MKQFCCIFILSAPLGFKLVRARQSHVLFIFNSLQCTALCLTYTGLSESEQAIEAWSTRGWENAPPDQFSSVPQVLKCTHITSAVIRKSHRDCDFPFPFYFNFWLFKKQRCMSGSEAWGSGHLEPEISVFIVSVFTWSFYYGKW